jgi:hypothetical protein
MAEPTRPEPAKTFGRENYIFIPTIAAAAALTPTVAEATAASALDITRVVFEGGEPTLNANTERVELDARAGDDEVYEHIGRTKYEGGDLMGAWDPQAAALSDDKIGWEQFLNTSGNVTGFLAKRENIVRADAIVAAQRLSYVIPVEFGPPTPTKQGSGSAAQAAFKVTFAVTGAPKFDVAVLA